MSMIKGQFVKGIQQVKFLVKRTCEQHQVKYEKELNECECGSQK